jgi:hypothetical protein
MQVIIKKKIKAKKIFDIKEEDIVFLLYCDMYDDENDNLDVIMKILFAYIKYVIYTY